MQHVPLPAGSRLITIPMATDGRGSLSFATQGQEIPFAIARVFWIHDVPEGARRGGHSHNTCSEVVVAVTGGFRMTVDNGRERRSVVMDSPNLGILIPAGMWCELSDFQPGTVVVVAASEPYDASGYCNNYNEYVNSQHTDKL